MLEVMEEMYGAFTKSGALNTLVGGRMRPGWADENEPSPYITYNMVSDTPVAFGFKANRPIENKRIRIQFDVWVDADRVDSSGNRNPDPTLCLRVAYMLRDFFDWFQRTSDKFDLCTAIPGQVRLVREEQYWRATVDYVVTLWAPRAPTA